MAVSPSVVCLNTSRHRLYKLSHSTSMPNLTTGYSTVTWGEVVFFSKKKKKKKKKEIGIHSMQGWTASTRHGVTTKRDPKRSKHTGKLFWKNPQLIGLPVNSRLKAI